MLTLNLTLDNGQVSVHANERQSHLFSLRDLDNTDLKNFVNDPKPYGGKLFQALFKDGSEARTAFDELSMQTERTIVLVLESSELDGIAWEYAYHDNAYIVEDFPFIRALPEQERPHAHGRLNKSVERVPLLFIPANPLVDLSGEPMRELDIESEWREMTQHIVKSNAPFDLIELRPTTPAALQSIMARFQNGMIAHFSGHGAATKDGAFLLFENENGSSNPLEAREFVREVKDQAWIGFLSACQSAVAERTAFGNLARELVKAGVPFALGMQFNLPDPFAPVISGQFYNWLAQGHAIPEATMQARRAVNRENEFYVGMIALYAANPDEAGKMGWTGSGARTTSTFAAADVSDLPTPSGFIGRQRELMNIGTQLLAKKNPNTVTLHGAGGIGKTALMRQVLLRFASSFESTLVIALDPLPSLESVLGRLEQFLNLPSPCSNNTKEREQIVHRKLTGSETLLGLDNFETLIHARDNGSDEEKKTAKSLYAFFKSLAAEGVTLCVTSREKTSLPGETIQEIHGLEDEVGGRLFQNTVSTRRDALNGELLEKISAAVGGHPLALRLLAPIFEEQAGLTLDAFVQKLETFLLKTHDEWTEQERHESLGACFAFSMDNLPKTEEGRNLQTALARLSVFTAFFVDFTAAPVLENGFSETDELFSESRKRTGSTLHVLWERGLLERVVIPLDEENFYIYRLHPAISIFAKERLTDVEIVKENYWKSMNNFARIAEEQMGKIPLMAQISFYAIPDLIASSNLGSSRDSALMRFRVSKFLNRFGLFDSSLALLEQSAKLTEDLGDQQGNSAVLLTMASIYDARGERDKALKLYKKSMITAEETDNLEIKANTALTMASVYAEHGDLGEAMKMHQRSLELSEGLGNLQLKAVNLSGMAEINISRGNLSDALKLYEQSLKITEGLGDVYGQSTILFEMAGVYVSQGHLDKAMLLCQQSLDFSVRLLEKPSISKILNKMADIYKRYGNLDKAMEFYRQALEISEEIGNLKVKSETLAGMGVIFVQNQQYPEALRSFVTILAIFERIGQKLMAQTYEQILLRLRQQLGADKFDALWKDEIRQPIPEWLKQQPEEQERMNAKQFIEVSIQSAREQRPEAGRYFVAAQEMASDPNESKELQELGKVIQSAMRGDKGVDLSGLREDWAELVKRELGE